MAQRGTGGVNLLGRTVRTARQVLCAKAQVFDKIVETWPRFVEGANLRVGLAAANNSFAKLIRLAQQGEVIVITRNGRAVAELRRLVEPQPRRRGADPVQDLLDDCVTSL